VHGFKNKKKRKERSTGIIEKGGKKKPVRKEITDSMSGDRVSMKNKDVAQREEGDHRRRDGSGPRSAHWNTVASGGSWP
jgi:hypothetical protein